MTTSYVFAYDYCQYVGADDDPSDEPYSGYSHVVRDNFQFQLFKKRPEDAEKFYFYELDKFNSGEDFKDQDMEGPVLVVFNLYSDGGTFGCEEGYVEVIGLCQVNDPKEDDLYRKAHGKDYGYFGKLMETKVMLFNEIPVLTPKLK